ncbi:uncharacterized protein TrAtP1_008233 [Trichoderma atroviride]|uniref:uncharacterized protein n=1 Tax=Hypocrea atroviridis TaxID=63577 RepID=UPI0033311EF2|nr:hypothetical protein TrAtP1_008233 [Trichoderma atroviride]
MNHLGELSYDESYREIVKEHGQKAATNSFYTPAAPVTGPTGDDQGETVNEVPFRLQTYP